MNDLYISVKTSRAYYTDEKIRNAKNNIQKYNWAKVVCDKAVNAADTFLDYGVENIIMNTAPQDIPRSFAVNQEHGCPICGEKALIFGNYSWKTDYINYPWKIFCPSCQSEFPSNDFNSYYKSGFDENGVFRREKADSKYLVNVLYPDKPADWCVDDGYGWIDESGSGSKGENNHTFIAWYNHMMAWWPADSMSKFKNEGFLLPAIRNLKDSYLFTGDRKYAEAGIAILNRIAYFYPEMDSGKFKWEDGFKNFHGLSGKGKAIGCIWECNLLLELVRAYDAFFPEIDNEIAAKIGSYPYYYVGKKPETKSDIISNIENGILMEVFPNVKNFRISGNAGMHQNTLITTGVVLENDKLLDEYCSFMYHHIENRPDGPGELDRLFINDVDRDGAGNEASPHYNSLWEGGFSNVAEMLYGNEKYDLYRNIKFFKLFNNEANVIMLDNYTLSVGDASGAGNPGVFVNTDAHISFFEKTGSVQSAQLLYYKSDGESICKNIFKDCENIDLRIKNTVKKYGKYSSRSRCLSGYGLSSITSETAGGNKSLYMYYGRNNGHGHCDTLQIGIHAFGIDMMPEHGYPNYTGPDMERSRWTSNMISHNTAMIRKEPPKSEHELSGWHDTSAEHYQFVGLPHHYDSRHKVGIMDVEAPGVYPQSELFRRSTVNICIGENDMYVMDFFRIKGGKDHYYSFHGAEGDTAAENLNLTKQQSGTYAGENIKYKDPSYDIYYSDGFDYLYDVRRDTSPLVPFSLDYKITDSWKVWDRERNVHLKLTMLGTVGDAAVAYGQPPQNNQSNPDKFSYLIAHNGSHAENGMAESCFCALIEPFENNSAIKSVGLIPLLYEGNISAGICARVVRTELVSGRVDYLFSSIDDKIYSFKADGDVICFSGFLGLISFLNGRIVYSYFNDISFCTLNGKIIADGKCRRIRGRVISFTKELCDSNVITVDIENGEDIGYAELTGKFIDIENDKIRNAFYEIKSASRSTDGKWTLGIGDVTFIRGLSDIYHPEKGYIYDICENAGFTIPLSCESVYIS